MPEMTVAVLASCQRPALWTWPSCLYLQALPDSFSGGNDRKADDYTGRSSDRTSKVVAFRQADEDAGRRSAPSAARGHPLPLQSAKKNPSRIGLGFESTKGGGWRRHRAIDGAGQGGLCGERFGYVTGFRFRTLARSSAPSFDGLNYTYGLFSCKKICTAKFNTTIRNA